MKLLKKFAITATIAASFMAIFSSCNNAVVESEAKAPAGVLRSDSSNGYAEDKSYQKDVMYFLFVDRFYDGDSSNNNGNSAAQYDTTHGSDLSLYQGGDLAGLNQKLDYLKDMGITSIWVTPLVDNRDVNDSMTYGSPYHGYHAHDFFNIDEHWGSWEEFDALVAKMHSNDYKMRLILDYAPNHSNQSDCGERAALYKSYYDENGNWLRREFLTDIDHDTNKEWYHQLGGISGTQWEDNYWCRYGNLYNLADLNQDNPTTYAYLADALEMWLKRGVDGVRLDAVKHMNTSFTKSLVSDMESRLEKDIYFFGEWFGAGYGATQLKVQGQEFEHTTGCSLLDFLYRDSMQAALLGGSVRSLADYLSNRETYWAEPLRTVVFLDNHDMARINTTLRNAGMNESKAAAKTNVGLAVTMTVRGVPCIYYGTEHYDARFESGGTDPYNGG